MIRSAMDEVSPIRLVSSSNYPSHNSSLSTTASSSNLSVWSDASSQSSDDTTYSSTSDPERTKQSVSASLRLSQQNRQLPPLLTEALPSELRKNSRRTSSTRSACPPTLVRQEERKVSFVDSLVDSSTQIVEAIWPLSSIVSRHELGSKAVLPLRTFIQETLRRSRTSYSTLQVALYYLILIKPHVPKHNFTTEQPEDRSTDRALQCGRRMFLSALILASKYLQDRNYSARAWSKISGLNTHEINQNEIAFLMAVRWKLHIADDVFKRWTEIVLMNNPSTQSPPSPGGLGPQLLQQTMRWKKTILALDVELTNVGDFIVAAEANKLSDLSALSPRSILNAPQECSSSPAFLAPTPKRYSTPAVLEPTPTSVYTPGLPAPALGMLPTPRLTPQMSGFCTPAASAATQMLAKSSGAMCLAMNQAGSVAANQCLDRLPLSAVSSPQGFCPIRRSSLATSISTASSPESMISDTSRTSRSSSTSSASSLASASANCNKFGTASRFRGMKMSGDRLSVKPSISSVPENYDEGFTFTASPESFTVPVNRLQDMQMDASVDAYRVGSKRPRPTSMDNLQDNVRGMLRGSYDSPDAPWSESLVRQSENSTYLQVPSRSDLPGPAKRLCCSTEAAQGFQFVQPPLMDFRGNGIWSGILN